MLVTMNQIHKQQNLMIIQWHRQGDCIVPKTIQISGFVFLVPQKHLPHKLCSLSSEYRGTSQKSTC